MGYSDKIDYSTEYRFSFNLFEVGTKRHLLAANTYFYPRGCSEDKIYRFLSEQAFQRIDFYQVVNQNFTIEMPEGYRCY